MRLSSDLLVRAGSHLLTEHRIRTTIILELGSIIRTGRWVSRNPEYPETRLAFLVVALGPLLMAFVRAMVCRGTRRNEVHRRSMALTSPRTIEETFIREAEELRWLAAVTLASDRHVEDGITDAVRLAESGGHVSPETVWIQRATARAAVEGVRSQIQKCVENRIRAIDANTPVAELCAADKRALRAVAIDRIGADCDALERGQIQSPSVTDCGFTGQYCAKSNKAGNGDFSAGEHGLSRDIQVTLNRDAWRGQVTNLSNQFQSIWRAY